MRHSRLTWLHGDFSVSEDGSIIVDLHAEELCYQHLGPQGYMVLTVDGKTTATHRVVASAWLPYNDDGSSPIVNHKDGNKLNNHYTNLEWCTYSDNNTHAYTDGLRPDNITVLIKNLNTGNISEHYSLHDAGRFIGCRPNSIHYYLKDPDKVRRGCYVIIEKGNPWPNLHKDDIVDIPPNNRISPTRGIRVPSRVSVLDTTTGTMEEWISLKEFANNMGVNKQSVEKAIYLNGGRTSNSGRWRHYQITYLNKTIANHDKDTRV